MNPAKAFPPVVCRSGFCLLKRMPAVRAFYGLVGDLPGTFRATNKSHASQIAHVLPKIATANGSTVDKHAEECRQNNPNGIRLRCADKLGIRGTTDERGSPSYFAVVCFS
jgi:hypothetical protein